MEEKTRISLTVNNIVYRHSNGFTVIKGNPKSGEGSLTAVGEMPPVNEGQDLDLTGHWTVHKRYGKQFQVEECKVDLPRTEDGIRNYLASDMVSGIGPKLAERITDEFGKETLKVINENPQALTEVPGIGKQRLGKIKDGWDQECKIRSVMLSLKRFDISTNHALKVYREYEEQAPHIVKNEPYRLARDIEGIGFKRADRIAKSTGLASNDPARIKAGIIYVLRKATEDGHLFLPKEKLLNRAQEILSIAYEEIGKCLQELKEDQKVIEEGGIKETSPWKDSNPPIYLTTYFNAETGLAQRLAEKAREKKTEKDLPSRGKVKGAISSAGKGDNIDFNQEQKEAIETALVNKISIITGGPGTGKTTAVRGIIRTFEELSKKVLLVAPTGRAAKRLSAATGREASTIHRLLGYKPPDEFTYHEGNKLKTDAIIIDEMSMVDLLLMDNLIKALPEKATIVMVGDADQLPPVGPGDVLDDLISSEEIPTAELSEIHRQARQSQIVTNAHRVNRGDFPFLEDGRRGDFWFFREGNPEKAARRVVDLAANKVVKQKNLDPFSKIQVLTPMHQGICGVENLNSLLQNELNPDSKVDSKKIKDKFAPGDKVMQVENDYERNVFNGDIGRITSVDPEENILQVDFPERSILNYSGRDLNKLVLAYAITIHKSQGSEYEAVILPLLTQHYVMLQRNLLYTAITRSKQLVAVVGTKKSLALAINNDEQQVRHSLLADRLKRNAS